MNPPESSALQKTAPPPLSAFPQVREERLRLTDLDFQMHVNNAAVTALLANARFDYLGEVIRPLLPAGDKLVIASLQVDFLHEMIYGPPVFTGTRTLSIGRSSLKMEQGMYQDGICAGRAVSIFVHLDGQTRTSSPWPDAVRALVS